MKWAISQELDLRDVAAYLVNELGTTKTSKPAIIGLCGNLGAGKTTFTKYLAEALGAKDTVVSPTFILERQYDLNNTYGYTKLVHIDAYRFEGTDEGKVLALAKRFTTPDTLIVIEWPEYMYGELPSYTKLLFAHTGEGARTVEYIPL